MALANGFSIRRSAPYRGLPVQAIGIIPEKALKLSINDALRYRFRESDGKIALAWEGVAGGLAGFCQVIITCPMEVSRASWRGIAPHWFPPSFSHTHVRIGSQMYKIRMQLQNKKPVELRLNATQVRRLVGGRCAPKPGVISRGAIVGVAPPGGARSHQRRSAVDLRRHGANCARTLVVLHSRSL